MNRNLSALFLLLLPTLSGCAAACDLLGAFTGYYLGDAEGALEVDVTEVDKENIAIDITIGEPLSVIGSATIACGTDGFYVELIDNTDTVVGDFEGTLSSEGGDGDWSTLSGLAGTWNVTPMDQ